MFRSSYQKCSINKGALKNLFYIHFFKESCRSRSGTFLKRDSNTSAFLLNLLNSKEHLFIHNISCGCFWSYSRSHSFSTYAKFSEKLIFLTPLYANVSLSLNHSLSCWFTRYERLDYWNVLKLYYNKLKNLKKFIIKKMFTTTIPFFRDSILFFIKGSNLQLWLNRLNSDPTEATTHTCFVKIKAVLKNFTKLTGSLF